MEVTIRKDKNDKWCFVETFNVYNYLDKGNITVTVGISPEGKLVTPYILRNDTFIPLSVIEEEMGINKYIKAKKPFYCNLSDGFIASIKVGVDFKTGELLKDKTTYSVFSIASRDDVLSNTTKLHLSRILEVPEQVNELMFNVANEIAKCKGDREAYLRGRI